MRRPDLSKFIHYCVMNRLEEVKECLYYGVDVNMEVFGQTAAVYYAQQKYASEHDGQFTEDVFALVNYLSYPVEDEGVLLGECMGIPIIDLG